MSHIVHSLLSTAAGRIKPSPIREMFHLIRKPGMISFAGGMPDPDIFPVEQFHQGADILIEEGRDVLQYGVTEGYGPLKDFLSRWTAPKMGKEPSMDEILITSGSSQVADLMTRSLVDQGDWIVCEETSFLGNTINMYNQGANFLTVPCDENGMMVELLPERLSKAKGEGKRVKFIYTIPNFHNPLGCTMSLDRRKLLVKIAQEEGLMILEDDPYGCVRFEGEDLPTLYSLDNVGVVLYAGSFSKILAPGTRVGWAVGPKDLIRTMTVFKQGVDTCTSVVAQALVYKYCQSGSLDAFLPKIVDHYRKKRDGMEEGFKKYLPLEEVEYVTPQGGFFYWLTTPNILAEDLFKRAIEKKVAFVCGAPFFPNGGGEHSFRMCFTFASPEDTDKGIKALGEAMREILAETKG